SLIFFFFFSSRRRHTRFSRDWSSDVCSSDLAEREADAEADHDRQQEREAESLGGLGEMHPELVGRDEVRGETQGLEWRAHGDLRSEERRVGKGGGRKWAG